MSLMPLHLDDFELDPLHPLSFSSNPPSSTSSFFDPSSSSSSHPQPPLQSHSPAPSSNSSSTPDSLYDPTDDSPDDLTLSPSSFPLPLPTSPFLPPTFSLTKPHHSFYPSPSSPSSHPHHHLTVIDAPFPSPYLDDYSSSILHVDGQEGEEEEQEGEEEEEEEETPTPALAAVPPAEIVTATIADPSYIPNPAFANLGKMPSTHTLLPSPPPPAPAKPAALPTSLASATPPPILPAPIGPVAKRKYTKRAKKWTEGSAKKVAAAAAVAASPPAAALAAGQRSMLPSSAACAMADDGPAVVVVDVTSASSASAAADAFVSSIMRPASPVPVLTPAVASLASPLPRARSASSSSSSMMMVDVDDNASVASSHSHHSAQSAPLPSSSTATAVSASPLTVAPLSSPSTSPTSSPATSPRSISSITASPPRSASPPDSVALPILPTLAPPGKPGRKRKIKSEDASSLTSSTPSASSPSSSLKDSADDATDSDSSSSHAPSSSSSSSPTDPSLPPASTDNKKLVRLQRNRASAQLSRERKKQYMGELEKQLNALAQVNATLEQQLTSLAQENAELKARLTQDTVGGVISAVAVPVKKRPRLSTAHRKPSLVKALIGGGGVGGGGGGAGARTTLLMFSLIFSFALFYTMVGIDLKGEGGGVGGDQLHALLPHAVTPAGFVPPSFPGRVLQSLKDGGVGGGCPGNDSAVAPCEPLAIEAPPPSSRALIAVDTSADHKALVVQGEEAPDVQLVKEESSASLYDPVRQYTTAGMANGTNVHAQAKSTYLLCPDAVSIQPTLVREVRVKRERDGGEREGGSASAKRLRRTLGLPSPPSPSALTASAPPSTQAKLALAPNDHLLLWIPSAHLLNTSSEPSDAAGSSAGLVQISCQVSSIEPVLRA